MTHTIFDLVYSAIIGWCSEDLDRFSAAKKHGFGNLYRTTQICAIKSSGEFNQKPAVILLLVAIMVAFLESLRISVLYPLHYLQTAAFKFHTFLLFHFLGVLVHSAVELFHLFITMDLLCHKFFLSRFEFHNISYMWVQAIGFDNIDLLLAYLTFAAKFVSLDQEVRHVVAPLRTILQPLGK